MRAGVVLAARNVPAERRRAAALDRAHHLQLVEAHVPAVGFTPSGTVVAEDFRDLQGWAAHAGGALCGLGTRLGTPALLPQPAVLGAEPRKRALDGSDAAREAFKNAANRRQLYMWLRCEWGPSLRAAISSIMRWRSGLTVLSVLMGSFS